MPADGELILNAEREAVTLMVANTGDRPVQVGSHYHFAESNAALDFDRTAAHGRRLDIAPGTAVRFEPGQRREVNLIALSGARRVFGFNKQGDGGPLMATPIHRADYAAMFGPTAGDKIRLADTDLIIEVERDSDHLLVKRSNLAAAR